MNRAERNNIIKPRVNDGSFLGEELAWQLFEVERDDDETYDEVNALNDVLDTAEDQKHFAGVVALLKDARKLATAVGMFVEVGPDDLGHTLSSSGRMVKGKPCFTMDGKMYDISNDYIAIANKGA